MRTIALAALVAACVTLVPVAAASPIAAAGAELRHMQLVMGQTPSEQPATWTQLNVHPRVVYREQRALVGLLLYTRHVYRNVPNKSAWLCIHHYEGAWNDPNPPFWGGLQMDLGFQQTYGGYLLAVRGTADHWTPLEQMWTAERARRSGRGFYPWPNTARYCGLI